MEVNKKLLELIKEVLLEEKTKRDRCLRIADKKFDKPSAYKSGAVVRCRKGDIWKNLKEAKELNIQDLAYQQIPGLLEKGIKYELAHFRGFMKSFYKWSGSKDRNDFFDFIENVKGEIKRVPLSSIKPSQFDEDYKNPSSEYEAEEFQKMLNGEKNIKDHRKEDFYPILVNKRDNKIIDGNHRHYALSAINSPYAVVLYVDVPKQYLNEENNPQDFFLDIPKFNYPKTLEENLWSTLNEITLNPNNAAEIEGDEFEGEFKVGDIEYTYFIDYIDSPYGDESDFYSVAFDEKHNASKNIPTGNAKENYIKILSTMYKIILNFIQKQKPEYIGIASMDNMGSKNYHAIYANLTDNKSNRIPGYFRKDVNLPFNTPQGKGRMVVLKRKNANTDLEETIKKIIQEDESLHKWFKRSGTQGLKEIGDATSNITSSITSKKYSKYFNFIGEYPIIEDKITLLDNNKEIGYIKTIYIPSETIEGNSIEDQKMEWMIDKPSVEGVYLNPEYRGKGLGERLYMEMKSLQNKKSFNLYKSHDLTSHGKKIWDKFKEKELVKTDKRGDYLQEDESLHKWFKRSGTPGKEGGWVDCNAPIRKDGKITGYKPCGRKEGEKRAKYPSCRPTASKCKDPGKGKKWGKTK